MRMHRRPLLAAGAATALLTLTACGGGAEQPPAAQGGGVSGEISIGYAAGGEWGDYIEGQLDEIRAQYPDLVVTSVVYPTYDDQLNQMPNQFAAGTAPDIIQWDGAAPIAQYATEGILAPLDDLVADAGKDLGAYPDSLIEGWRIDGELYGLPLFLQHSAFAYNTELLAEAGISEVPSTPQALAEAAAAVAEQTDAQGVVLLDTLFHISQYLYAFGGGYDYGRTINSAENVEGLQFLLGLFAEGHASTAQELGATWDGEAFGAGDAAISDAGPWYVSFVELTAPDLQWALEPLPSVDGEPTVVAYSGGFSINGRTDNLEAAYAVVDMFTSQEAQADLLASGTQVPAMTEYLGEYRDGTPVYSSFTDEVIGQARTLDYPLQTTEFGNALVTGFQDLVFNPGSSTAQELLDELQETYGP